MAEAESYTGPGLPYVGDDLECSFEMKICRGYKRGRVSKSVSGGWREKKNLKTTGILVSIFGKGIVVFLLPPHGLRE
jgi:hypothetical protein